MNEQKKIEKIVENIHIVREKISLALEKSGRKNEKVLLIVVTKNQPKEQIAELISRCPGLHIGENRVSEAKEKKAFFDAFSAKKLDYHLHFIGRLQTNKVKDFLKISNVIHSLDRYSVIDEIEKQLAVTQQKNNANPHKIRGFLQLNVSGEESKAGFSLEQVDEFLPRLALINNIDFVGLMTMAPFHDEIRARECFRLLKEAKTLIATKCPDFFSPSTISSERHFSELSMGMSGDYLIAIEEGATCVRVGSAIFDFS